jgi:hypothetical protein
MLNSYTIFSISASQADVHGSYLLDSHHNLHGIQTIQTQVVREV